MFRPARLPTEYSSGFTFQGILEGWVPYWQRSDHHQIPREWWNEIDSCGQRWNHWWVLQTSHHGWYLPDCPPLGFMVVHSTNNIALFWQQCLLLGLICIIVEMEIKVPEDLTREQFDLPHVSKVFKSFRWIRCSYRHFDNPAHHYLHALRLLVMPFEISN